MENVLNRIPEKKPLDKEATPSAQKRDKGDGGGSGRGDDPSKETTHETYQCIAWGEGVMEVNQVLAGSLEWIVQLFTKMTKIGGWSELGARQRIKSYIIQLL